MQSTAAELSVTRGPTQRCLNITSTGDYTILKFAFYGKLRQILSMFYLFIKEKESKCISIKAVKDN